MHHSACMHQKHLLRFIKSKLRKEPDEVVIFRDGKWLTLKEVFESLHLTGCAPLLHLSEVGAQLTARQSLGSPSQCAAFALWARPRSWNSGNFFNS